MCGIIGYVGQKDTVPLLIDGLKRLEYRGYDSAGIAVADNNKLVIGKVKGKINDLAEEIKQNPLPAKGSGIAHTRWATHGIPSTINAHPHISCNNRFAVVHNGIIENYEILKSKLIEKGHKFKSDTDTEVIVHLIEEFYKDDFFKAVRTALKQLEGTYGILVLCSEVPDSIIAARNGSPLLIGIGDNQNIIASDASAILEHTKKVVYLKDGEIAEVKQDDITIKTIDNILRNGEIVEIKWDISNIEKNGYDHFMLKEIYEQINTVKSAFAGRLDIENNTAILGGLNLTDHELHLVKRILIVACGTSWHAGLVGKYVIEELAGIPVDVEYASEFRYRNTILEKDTLAIAITQSGETADTIAAMREIRRKGIKVLGITNVVGSSAAQESDGGIYLHAGPEIGVASTKAFTSQIVILILIGILFGRMRYLSAETTGRIINEIQKLPDTIKKILKSADYIKKIADEYANKNNALYLGRGINYPVALEGALKMKEISYIHAEGYPAAEMKHGPIALIDKDMPVVVIALKDSVYEKVLNNIEQVRSRGGKILAITTKGDKDIINKVSHHIHIPETEPVLTPVLSVIPLQLLAYYAAIERGCDVDQPRNLAKSVTVE